VPRGFALCAHEVLAVHALGLVLVVRGAEQSQVVERRAAAAGDGHDVIDLQVRALAAAPPRGAQERALVAIALGDLAFQLGRDVTAVRVAATRAG
jgi:hypothetical protein